MSQLRLITAKVRTQAMDDARETIVSLRINVDRHASGDGSVFVMPAHACVATNCDECQGRLLEAGARRLGLERLIPEFATVEILDDRFATPSNAADDVKAAEQLRREQENEMWRKFPRNKRLGRHVARVGQS